MVDREARREYAELVRQFISGRMTNGEYEARYDKMQFDLKDPAVGEVYHQVWFCYDDIRAHRMTGPHRLDRENRRVIAQAVLFLQSDDEYPWPKDVLFGISLILWLVLAGMLSLVLMRLRPDASVLILAAALVSGVLLTAHYGFRSIIENRNWKAHGDTAAWPFLLLMDLEEARRHPRLLNGKKTMP